MSTFGDRLRAVRKYYNLSQEEFAESLSIAQSYLSLMEKGKRNPSGQLYNAIKEKYNVNSEWINNATGEMFTGGRPANTASLLKPKIGASPEVLRSVVIGVEECAIKKREALSPKEKANIIVFYCDYFDSIDEPIGSRDIIKEIRLTFDVTLRAVGGQK